MNAMLVTIVIALIAWFWANSLRARELALDLSRQACASMGVQFLDQTVSISKLGIGRAPSGSMTIHRVYSFEFTNDGSHRWKGQVALQGGKVKAIHLNHPDGPVVIGPDQLS